MSAFYLHNLGCAKNLVEGEHLAGMLLEAGHKPVDHPEGADLVIINTCGFLQAAVEEAIEAIFDLAQFKHDDNILVVLGCLVGRYGKKLAEELPEVDLLIAPGETQHLLDHLSTPPEGKVAISRATGVFDSSQPRAISTGPGWGWLRVADGCNHRCHFCAIPMIRGNLRSRSIADLTREAEFMVDQGMVELNLIAQDLASFGRDNGEDLISLLQQLNRIDGLQWVRMLYLHPDMLDIRFVQNVMLLDKVLPYYDIPLQHIADPVLKAMGRRKSSEDLKELVRDIRLVNPEATLRTTFLVGHPGEDETAFNQALDFVDEGHFDHLGAFAFSPEHGTRSARMERPDYELAQERQGQIIEAQRPISAEKLAARVGRTEPILVLGEHPESELLWAGRLKSQAPEVDGEVIIVDGDATPGSIVNCRITGSHDYDLEAELLD